MRKLFSCLLLLTLCSFAILAQKPESASPPKVALIIREEIKPGMMPAHSRHSAMYSRTFNKLQTPNYRIALVPFAGSENEVMYLTGADTFAELESINKETDRKMSSADGITRVDLDRLEKEAPLLHSGMRDILCVYR